ncbi:hypothetical protein BA184_08115 [Helicobacter pullorum]|uniref:hypothetical protein n=2 Tax=Helicobacter pullorum TaxID=35818 RepID=UPI0008169D7D|nr:hypothetical protein [Helicobacter pullorum]OCR06973.1 hypothetical protein BA185_06055 [Helicobacter pullorum]OCR08786.1 hypothetical protein BA184_08115 [Helicobacter pullorum]
MMSELPFYCEIASEARSILWSFWWIPIIPFLSLCLVVWNLGLLWELKQESKKKDSTPKEQLQERKKILIKGIIYASILPIIYLWVLSQDLMMGNLFGVTYRGATAFFTFSLLPAILAIYNIILLSLSYTQSKFAIKHNLKKRRKEYIIVIVPMMILVILSILALIDKSQICNPWAYRG